MFGRCHDITSNEQRASGWHGTYVADDTYDVFVSYSRADGRHAVEIDSVLRDKGRARSLRPRRRSPSGVSHRKRRSASRRGSNLYWLRLWSSAPYRRQFFFQRSQLSVAPANGLADRFLKVLTVLVFAVVDQFVVRADYYDVRFFARGGLG